MQFRFCWCEVHRHCQLNCTGLQVLRLALCSSPPSYDTVAKIDKVELPCKRMIYYGILDGYLNREHRMTS